MTPTTNPLLQAALNAHARQQAAAAAQPSQLGVHYSPIKPTRRTTPKKTDQPAQSGNLFADLIPEKKPKRSGLGAVLGAGGGIVGKAFTAIDTPRRAVLAAVKEGGDANLPFLRGIVDGDKRDDASWSDFVDQLKDPSFGFGSIAPQTGNKWLDRGVGFTGDLALDPLTWMTGGSSRFAGAGGRATLAGELAAKGAAESTIAKAGRLGLSGLDEAERAAVGAGRGGIYFGVEGAKVRVPGTGGISSAASHARAAVGDLPGMSRVRAWRSPDDLTDAYETLASAGRRGSLTVDDAAGAVYASNQRRIATNMARSEAGEATRRFMNGLSDTERKTVYDLAEQGVDTPATRAWKAYTDEVRQIAVRNGVDIGEVENYVPHLWTQQGRKWLNDGGKLADDVKRVFHINDASASGRSMARSMKPGTYRVGSHTIVLETGSIREINEKLGSLAGVKLLEDDIGMLASKYAEDIATDVGKVSGWKHASASESRAFTPEGAADYVDVRDVKATRKATSAFVDYGRSTARGFDEVADGFQAAANKATGKAKKAALKNLSSKLQAAKTELGEVEQAVRELAVEGRRLDVQSTEQLRKLTVSQGQAKRNLGKFERLEASVVTPAAKQRHYERWSEAVDHWAEVDDVLSGELNRLVSAKASNEQMQAALRSDAGRLQVQVEVLQDDLSALRGVNADAKKRLVENQEELAHVASMSGDDATIGHVASLLAEAQAAQIQLAKHRETATQVRSYVRTFSDGNNVVEILERRLSDGFERIGDDLLAEGERIVVSSALAESMKRVSTEVRKGGLFKVLDNYTAFFKAYATATPGFHVRNLMGATFMNYADGVATRDMLESLRLWKQYANDPSMLTRLSADDPVRAAFEATFGSGAGGRFSVDALDTDDLTAALRTLADNRVTRASRKAGEWVEGPVRLAAALNSTKAGASAQEALARVTRLHFDYSQLSNLDRNVKRFVPFWTFMSRNLPLQMQQMFMKPKLYNRYASFVRNFAADDDDGVMPLWWRERGAFKIADSLPFMPNEVFAAPDMPFTSVDETIDKLRDPRRVLADANPLLRVPFETLITGKKAFTGQEFYDDENKLAYAAEQLIPVVPQAQRLGADRSEYASERRVQSVLNWLGIPLRELTPNQFEAELRRLANEGQDG